jgi:hypothetical protein
MPRLFEGVHRGILHPLRLLIARSPVLSRGFQEQINEFPLIKKLTEKNNLIITYKFMMNITEIEAFSSQGKSVLFLARLSKVSLLSGEIAVLRSMAKEGSDGTTSWLVRVWAAEFFTLK